MSDVPSVVRRPRSRKAVVSFADAAQHVVDGIHQILSAQTDLRGYTFPMPRTGVPKSVQYGEAGPQNSADLILQCMAQLPQVLPNFAALHGVIAAACASLQGTSRWQIFAKQGAYLLDAQSDFRSKNLPYQPLMAAMFPQAPVYFHPHLVNIDDVTTFQPLAEQMLPYTHTMVCGPDMSAHARAEIVRVVPNLDRFVARQISYDPSTNSCREHTLWRFPSAAVLCNAFGSVGVLPTPSLPAPSP